MPARRTALAVVLAGAAAFGGGAAVAATHGGGAPAMKPPKHVQLQHPAASNVHIPCHNHSGVRSASV